MKTTNQLLLVLLFISFSNFTFTQKPGDIIKLTTYNKVLKFENIIGTNKDTVRFLAPNILFRVNKVLNDSILLKALNFTKDEENKKLYNDKIYYINKNDFERSYEEYVPEDKLSIGLLTLPFKARPQDDFSFDTEFNLSTTLNYKFYKVYNAKVNAQIGAGIGSVNLNSSNASGITDDKAQDVATLNFFGGLMLEYKKVQAGIYVGVDQINNQSEYKWNSNGNLWFGFGIGFNVFKISLGEKDEQ
ncbi:MAG: hypothetical protein ACSHXA_10370 [Polaribacter sp.]|jgi:hypothetical protein|uniref:hypothetical protein n=1 Tax=Polaribacter sp. TaxID=1920175 RepID=UPI003EFA24D4